MWSIIHSSLTECSGQRHKWYVGERQKKDDLQKRAKLLQFDDVTSEMHKFLDVSRLSEWNNYLKFEAVKLTLREDAERMLKNTDAEIEVNKNEFKRTEQDDIQPRMKLPLPRDLSQILTRSDSPTAEKDEFFILVSLASSRRHKICVGDLAGYVWNQNLSAPLILSQPRGGMPDPRVETRIWMLCASSLSAEPGMQAAGHGGRSDECCLTGAPQTTTSSMLSTASPLES